MVTSSKILDSFIEMGKSYALFFGNDHPANKRISVLAVVDSDMIVWRFLKKDKTVYKVDHISLFEGWYKEGALRT